MAKKRQSPGNPRQRNPIRGNRALKRLVDRVGYNALLEDPLRHGQTIYYISQHVPLDEAFRLARRSEEEQDSFGVPKAVGILNDRVEEVGRRSKRLNEIQNKLNFLKGKQGQELADSIDRIVTSTLRRCRDKRLLQKLWQIKNEPDPRRKLQIFHAMKTSPYYSVRRLHIEKGKIYERNAGIYKPHYYFNAGQEYVKAKEWRKVLDMAVKCEEIEKERRIELGPEQGYSKGTGPLYWVEWLRGKAPPELTAREFERLKRYPEAAEIYKEMGRFASAARCYDLAGDKGKARECMIAARKKQKK